MAEADFKKMIADENLADVEYKFDVIQVGSRHWVGRVIVWKEGVGSYVHGIRESGSSPGQWVAGDKMLLQTCNGKYQLLRIII